MKRKQIISLLLAGVVAASLGMTGCGISATDVGATYEGEDISLGYMNFVAHYTQYTYDSFFLSYYGEDYWTNESQADEDGKTMEESVKDDIAEEIELEYLMETHMADYGVEITEDEQAAMKIAAETFMDENTSEAIKAMGATEEYVQQMLYYQTISHKMDEAIRGDIDTEVTDEESARGTYSYVEIPKMTTDDAGVVDVLSTSEELGVLTDAAEMILESAQAGIVVEAEDEAEAATEETDPFDAAAEAYGYTVYKGNFNPNLDAAANAEEASLPEELLTVVMNLKDGEYADILETEGAYYVVRLNVANDETATQAAVNQILTDRADAKFTEVTDGYKEESSFVLDEKQWAKVKFTDLFTQPETDEEAEVTE